MKGWINKMNNPEIYNIVGCAAVSALTHEGKIPADRFVVWKHMGKTTAEIGRFRYRSLAETFVYCQKELYRSAQFQITNVGETPIWD